MRISGVLVGSGLFVVAVCVGYVAGAEPPEEGKIEAVSPDGRFAFRYASDAPAKAESEADADADEPEERPAKRYELIERHSGKVIAKVAESNWELGPSARFVIEGVLWKPDSSAFAITAYLWKRGSSVSVFRRDGTMFREVKLPELGAEVPQKEKHGKSFPHVSELDSQSAVRWQKDGSLVVEVETMIDGNDGSMTATRTVTLSFDRAGKAKIARSTIQYKAEGEEEETQK